MGVAWFYLGLFSMDRPLDALPKAREAAVRALGVNERDGEALSISACTKACSSMNGLPPRGCSGRLLTPNPGSELSKHLFALFTLLPMTRMDEALEMVDEATRIDPLSLFMSATKTAIFLVSHRYQEAEAECRRALELDPDFWRALVGLGRCYEAQGRYEAAIECFERATVLSDRVPSAIGGLGRAYALAGRGKESAAIDNRTGTTGIAAVRIAVC